jgi:hypothetical protein
MGSRRIANSDGYFYRIPFVYVKVPLRTAAIDGYLYIPAAADNG